MKDLFDILIRNYWENIQKISSLKSLQSNFFKALIHFKNYAYERNISGAAMVYRDIADIVLRDFDENTIWNGDLEKNIWNNFERECQKRNIGPNQKVNPLKPSSEKKDSLVKFVFEIHKNENKTVAEWAFRMISENEIKTAHDTLKKVWGIGDKIASFYLRDIFWLGHKLNPRVNIENDFYLQPIDIWLRRGAKALGHKETSWKSVAKCISSFEKENRIPHGGANIGFWILGSTYLVDINEFEDIIKAITQQSKNSSTKALNIAHRFKEFYGKFGEELEKIIQA